MAKSGRERLQGGRPTTVGLFALMLVCAAAIVDATGGVRSGGRSNSSGAPQAGQRLDISLRSFTPRANGHLTIEPDRSGGRVRLTARNLPDPQTLSRAARTYIVWATSEGRFLRIGELRRDERGNGGLAFTHPAEFERYTVLVTAESGTEPERPTGAPVLSTRAGEARAVYALTTDEGSSSASTAPADAPAAPSERRAERPRPRRATGDFYAEVDDALEAHGGGRALLLEGDALAARARGQARVTAEEGKGYVRVRFRGLPLPTAAGANTYVMWAIVPDGRIVYMGSLPATEELNGSDVYVRTAGFETDDFELFVTAEMHRPLHAPSDRRALSTRRIRSTIK